MKTITLLLIALSIAATAQKLHLSTDTQLVTCDTVIYFESKTADQLYDKAKTWFVASFRDLAIISDNKPNIIRGGFKTKYAVVMGKQAYHNDLLIKIKDGAVKVILDNFMTTDARTGAQAYHIEKMVVGKDGSIRNGGMFRRTNEDMEVQFKDMAKSLAIAIQKKDDF